MSETPTINIPLGFKAPDFTLPDTVSGKMMTFAQLKGQQGTVVVFICNHCPYVKHISNNLCKVPDPAVK
jgi:peroxiredoxin